MRFRICLAIVSLLAAALPAGAVRADGARQDELEALVKEIEAAGETLLDEKPAAADTMVTLKVKALTYDKESIQPLTALLNKTRKDPINLYVTNKLLMPLLAAKPEVVKAAIPLLKTMRARSGEYRQFLQYSPAQLKQYNFPTDIRDAGTPEQAMARISSIKDLQKQKMALERAVAVHNQQLQEFDKAYYALVLMGEPAEDSRLADTIVQEERKGATTWMIVLAAIQSEAPKMTAQRAKMLYESLLKVGEAMLRLPAKAYVDLGNAKLLPNANSTFGRVSTQAGIAVLTTVNQLATPAKMPAIKIPTPG